MSARLPIVRIATAGVWLGLLQTVLFFDLTFSCSSSFVAYAVLLVSWLGGSVVGVWTRSARATRPLVVVAALAPYGLHAALGAAPYSLALLPVGALFTGATGAFAGHLFQAERRTLGGLDRLFFVEGVGFLVGLVSAVLGALLLGRGALLATPAVGGLVLFALYTRSGAEASDAPTPAKPATAKPATAKLATAKLGTAKPGTARPGATKPAAKPKKRRQR